MDKTVLILGGNGRLGRHTAEAFWNAGWHVTLFDRTRDTLDTAMICASVVVAAWNLPYTGWADRLLPLHTRIQDAARAAGATVILPGNVYVFDPSAPAPWGPDTPQAAATPLGRVRVALEDSYRRSGVRTILLRAGDFIDTEPSEGWLDRVMLKTLPRGRLTYPGALDASHAWAYLPDLGRAAVALADRRHDLPLFTDIAFPGYTLTAHQMASALGDLRGCPVTARSMSWLPIRMAQPVWPLARHLLEMRYLWDVPHQLEGTAFTALLPGFRATPLETALARATAHIKKDRAGRCPRGPVFRSAEMP